MLNDDKLHLEADAAHYKPSHTQVQFFNQLLIAGYLHRTGSEREWGVS